MRTLTFGRLRVDLFDACGPLANNVYLIGVGGSTQAIVVDPALEAAPPLIARLGATGQRLALIVASHYHFDHVGNLRSLADATSAPVAAHRLDADLIVKPRPPTMFPNLAIAPAPVARLLEDGDVLDELGVPLEVLHTPGHSPGSLCLYARDAGVLFSGDTLFAGSYGRFDLHGGDEGQLWQSLARLAALPPATHVLPGHGPPTTIGREHWLPTPG